jgi:ketosteroid isomerase-like protein
MDLDHEPDQQAIVRSVLERYFNAVDRRDFDLLAHCFTPHVVFEFNLDTKIVVHGRDALVARMSAMPRPAASSHALSNTVILIDGEEARAVTFAVVHAVLAVEGGGRILVRGIRYDDRLVRAGESWRIAERQHNPLWQYEAAAVRPGA